MKNYIIVHGSFGSPQENWFPWLSENIIRGVWMPSATISN